MAANDHKRLLDDLGAEVEQLKVRFMLYFQGIERQNPAADRDLLKKALDNTRREASRWNTGDRFRMNAIYNKFMSYDRMWSRTLTEMENGTFRNDKKRVERKRKQEEEAVRKAAGVPDMTPEELAAVKKSVQAAARGQLPANGGGGGGGGMTDERMRRLYNVYMQAKKRTGERSNISFESLKAQLDKQIPAIKKKHNCQNVDFKVVLKNGKAMLKAVTK